MEKISVIIPVYKVEPYLRKCMDSVVNQTYTNLEIIAIDDGSPDNCGTILDEYAVNDDRIKIIHKENGGLTRAWMDGIKVATGDWIAFVDSDDWLEIDYFEKSIESIFGDDPDILQMGKFIEEFSEKSITRFNFPTDFFHINIETDKDYLMARVIASERKDGQKYNAFPYVWAKLYKASFIRSERLSFDPSIRAGLGCDGLFNFEAFGKAKSVKGCLYGGYHYRRTTESGTLRYGPDRPVAVYYILERLYSMRLMYGNSPLIIKAIEAYACAQILLMMATCYFHPENRKPYPEIASEIRMMKHRKLYHDAFFSKNNPFLTWKQKLFNLALRSPFVWPLKIAILFYSH